MSAYTYAHLLVDETSAWESYHGTGDLSEEAQTMHERLTQPDAADEWARIVARRRRMTADMTLAGMLEFCNHIRVGG